jgi:hypothetical protein
MAAVQGSVGNRKGMEGAFEWRMFPEMHSSSGNLPAVSDVAQMLGGQMHELIPIEQVQRLADRMRDGTWSPTSPSSGR